MHNRLIPGRLEPGYLAGYTKRIALTKAFFCPDSLTCKVLDRFWRADVSRSDTDTLSWLGLVLVQRIVEALGGPTYAQMTGAGIFSLHVVLPVRPKSPRPSKQDT